MVSWRGEGRKGEVEGMRKGKGDEVGRKRREKEECMRVVMGKRQTIYLK